MPELRSHIRYATGALLLAAVGTLASSGQATAHPNSANASTASSQAPVKKTVRHKHRVPKPAVKPVAQAPVAPPAPPKPDWPANDPAKAAMVNWDGRDLTVHAANASLGQVLHEVASATGLKVDGLDSLNPRDQRIYGTFGPASARDVLSELLEGSGYNSILVGDRGAGNPRELLLTAQVKSGAAAQNANHGGQANEEDEPAEEPEPQEQQPEPQRPQQGPPPPGARPAQQYLQDLRNQQQQQQQQPTTTPATPEQNPAQNPPN